MPSNESPRGPGSSDPFRDVVVVGGGVIGLSAAWRLAQRGAKVTLFDAGHPPASLAAAGLLLPLFAPAFEEDTNPSAHHPLREPFLSFLRESFRLYPEFVREVQDASDMPVDLDLSGAFILALNERAAGSLRGRVSGARHHGYAVDVLSGKALKALHPGVSAMEAAFFHGMGGVDNRMLVPALREAARRAGVTIHDNAAVREILVHEDRVAGVLVGEETIACKTVLLSAGARADQLLPRGEPGLGMTPVHGVLVEMAVDPGAVPHVFLAGHRYLVPRRNGTVLAGTTVEEKGFDVEPSAKGADEVVAGVSRFMPRASSWRRLRAWAGLRPRSSDGFPILGRGRHEGLWLAAGHFREGILTAPLTADWMARAVLTGEIPAGMAPFGIQRLSAAPRG